MDLLGNYVRQLSRPGRKPCGPNARHDLGDYCTLS
jgi:hypothetical protein